MTFVKTSFYLLFHICRPNKFINIQNTTLSWRFTPPLCGMIKWSRKCSNDIKTYEGCKIISISHITHHEQYKFKFLRAYKIYTGRLWIVSKCIVPFKYHTQWYADLYKVFHRRIESKSILLYNFKIDTYQTQRC